MRSNLGLTVPDELLLAGLGAWAATLGAISLEVFGHVDALFADPAVHFTALTTMFGRQVIGLPASPARR